MKIKDLKKIIEKYPDDLTVVVHEDLGDFELKETDIRSEKLFVIWHSDYNNNGIPYECLDYEPQQGEYIYPNGNVYNWRTVREIDCLILG